MPAPGPQPMKPLTLLTLLALTATIAAGLVVSGGGGTDVPGADACGRLSTLRLHALPGQPGASPRAGKHAGRFHKLTNVSSLPDCASACCAEPACHSAMLYSGACYTVACVSAKACAPMMRDGEAASSAIYLQLRAVCRADADCGGSGSGYYCLLGACQGKRQCSLRTVGDCGPGEECSFSDTEGSTSGGFCECRAGFGRFGPGECRPAPDLPTTTTTGTPTTTPASPLGKSKAEEVAVTVAAKAAAGEAATSTPTASPTQTATTTATVAATSGATEGATATSTTTIAATTTSPKREQLIVSAGSNRTIELPLNSIELHASIIPEPTGLAAKRLAYSWNVISGPREGQFQNRNSASLKLSDLSAGKYVLQVDVTDSTDAGRVGKAVVMVTVSPAKRKSKPPKAVIKPATLTIQLPNNAILDGSGSVDGDQKIESYKWQVVDGPLTAQDLHSVSVSHDQQILQLNNLRAGFYVLRLTVQDAKGLGDSTTANLTVLPEPDDKPKASAGQSMVIYLPQNNITLYGNASTDDHGIASYMWRQKGGSHLSADMQGVHTPVLHLSGLVEGDYAFELTVTDARGQADTAGVNVLVKQRRKNALPVVSVKPPELTVVLPLARLVVNATASDDTGIKAWQWSLISGPGSPQLANQSTPSVSLSGLQAGVYKLRVAATDLDGGKGETVATVTVKPGPNQRPKAVAGGDRVVQMDGTSSLLVSLDGSKSWDDKAIVEYTWTRKDVSLAVGQVLNGSDATPRLLLIGLLPGRYSFRLTVRDAEGATGEDEAAVLVRAWPHANSIASLELRADPAALRQSDLSSLLSQMQLTLRAPYPHCSLRLLGTHPRLSSIVLRLSARFDNGTHLPGTHLVALLKRRLPASLLEFPVLGLHTEVCQLGCSLRGYCDNATRQCVCASFWMENPLRARYGDGDSNCDWSVVYVSLGVTLGLLGLCAVVWLAYCCLRYRRAAGAHLRAKVRPAGRRLRKAAAATLGVGGGGVAGGGGSRDKVYYAPLNNGEASGRMSFSLSSDEEDTVYTRRVASDPSLGSPGATTQAGGGGGKADHNSNRIPMATMQAASTNGTAKDK